MDRGGFCIFASDLDQTLIYSGRSFATEGDLAAVSPVEFKDGREVTYMTKRAIVQLRKLVRKVLFIPVTTRTIEQYRRIVIFQEMIIPKYAVTSNGGNILIQGQPDLEWNRRVRESVRQGCLPLTEILENFNKLKQAEWFLTDRIADDLFYYCVVKREKIPEPEIAAFGQWAKEGGWHLSIQNRKIYFVPAMVSKVKAINYIRGREQISGLVAAGDSLLDLDMLQSADFALAPPHGEIYRLFTQGGLEGLKLNFTKATGILSSEEILDEVLCYYEGQNNGRRKVEF